MAKVELKISGMSHEAIREAIEQAGLVVRTKKYRLDGETYFSLVGGTVRTLAGHKVGEFQHMRNGLNARIDPTQIPPSSLAALLSIVSK
jgi:hypothetical protein